MSIEAETSKLPLKVRNKIPRAIVNSYNVGRNYALLVIPQLKKAKKLGVEEELFRLKSMKRN